MEHTSFRISNQRPHFRNLIKGSRNDKNDAKIEPIIWCLKRLISWFTGFKIHHTWGVKSWKGGDIWKEAENLNEC
jgi:hypothetical protein